MMETELSTQARTRLRRIEGQVRGIQGMLDKLHGCGEADAAGEPCDSLLNQVLAVRSAVEQVGLIILELHLKQCVLDGVEVDDETVVSLRDSIKRWSRLGSA